MSFPIGQMARNTWVFYMQIMVCETSWFFDNWVNAIWWFVCYSVIGKVAIPSGIITSSQGSICSYQVTWFYSVLEEFSYAVIKLFDTAFAFRLLHNNELHPPISWLFSVISRFRSHLRYFCYEHWVLDKHFITR